MRHLTLVGGGHAHVHVLKAFGLAPWPGVRVTLVTRDLLTPYSGMLPGHIAGLYTRADCHVDLARLCAFAGVDLVHASVEGADLEARTLRVAGRPPLPYDVASFDVGSAARLDAPGVAEHALTVRPVERFLALWEAALARARAGGIARVVVAGGGAAGVELLLNMQARLARETARAPAFTLVAGGGLAPGMGALPRRRLAAALRARGAEVIEAHAAEVRADGVTLDDGRRLEAELVVWATGAAAHPWLRETGLTLDEKGFIVVDAALRSVDDPAVFAAGDTAAVAPHPREKAGVYAVRQGPPLAENLRRALAGEAPQPFDPQRRALQLIGEGDRTAIGIMGPLALRGRAMWRLKDWIDRRWMAAYRDLPPRR